MLPPDAGPHSYLRAACLTPSSAVSQVGTRLKEAKLLIRESSGARASSATLVGPPHSPSCGGSNGLQ